MKLGVPIDLLAIDFKSTVNILQKRSYWLPFWSWMTQGPLDHSHTSSGVIGGPTETWEFVKRSLIE